MTSYNNTQTTSAVSAQKGSTFLLSFVLAIVRAALVIPAAVSLGPTARFFFPEMFAVPSNWLVLLLFVAVDTFVIIFALLTVRAQKMAAAKGR